MLQEPDTVKTYVPVSFSYSGRRGVGGVNAGLMLQDPGTVEKPLAGGGDGVMWVEWTFRVIDIYSTARGRTQGRKESARAPSTCT